MIGSLQIGAASRPPATARRRRWRRLQAPSVLGLVLFGFALVVTPLVLGLLASGVQISRLTRESERTLDQAVGVTRAAREVVDRVLAVERAARQYQVLRDISARANFVEQHDALRNRAQAMSALPLEPEVQAGLAELSALSERLAASVLADPGLETWPAALAAGFRELSLLGQSLTAKGEAGTERAIERLQALGDLSRGVVFMQIAATIPIAVALALVFTALITRPIRGLDKAIRALVNAGEEPIPKARGPRDLQALSVRLEWVRRKLLRIERDRQRLLGQVSHELKTPLSAIREGVGLLEEELLGPLDARQAEVVAILHRSVERLQQQIESLLRYNRLRSAPKPLERRAVPVSALVDEVLAAHRLTIAARAIALQTHIDPGALAVGDPDMLRTALDNLLSNAIKFAAANGRVGVFAGASEGTVAIEVADNGAGIDPADRTRVFEPFYRGRRFTDSQPGSGLGLAICRDLVRAHGGEVRLAEKPGWRTVFRITLPNDRQGEAIDERT